MVNWSDYEVIVAIQESRTLSAAARRLSLNQSTVSRILKKIELLLEEPLFSNASGEYELTAEGEKYFQIGKEMELAVSKLEKSPTKTKISGTVRITTIEALVIYLMGHIEKFNREFPNIFIELNESNVDANLSRRQFHCALRLEREEKSSALIIKKVGHLAVSGYQSRTTTSSDWIGYESSLASIPEEKWLKNKIQGRKPRLRVSSYATMEQAIANGLGVGLLPRFMGDYNSNLKRVTGEKPLLFRPIWFITHPDSRRDPAMVSFSSWLFKLFEEDKRF